MAQLLFSAETSEQNINLFNAKGNKLLNVITDPQLRNSSGGVKYQGEIYDLTRLKSLSDGYLTQISGEGEKGLLMGRLCILF